MSSKTIAIWCIAILLLAVAAAAWLGYVANGIAYGDLFGVRGSEGALAVIGARASRFLTLALFSEGLGLGIIVWRGLSETDIPHRLAAAVGISLLATICTFALVR